jgi:uncharacterized protein (DUF433 family)
VAVFFEGFISVESIIQRMVTTQYQFITKRTGRRGGRPYIKGVGVSVSTIVVMLNGGDSLESIVSAYPALQPAHVAEVRSYYAEHKKEIDAEIARNSRPPSGYTVGHYGVLRKK